MNLSHLRQALRREANYLCTQAVDSGDLVTLRSEQVQDTAEIIKALVRILEGKALGRAFESKHEWSSYSAGIVHALAAEPKPMGHDRRDGQRFCCCWFCLNTGPAGACENCGLPPSPERLLGTDKK